MKEYIEEYYSEEEVWKEVILFDSKYRYEISNKGNVRSYKTHKPCAVWWNNKTFKNAIIYPTQEGSYEIRYINTLIDFAFAKRAIAETDSEIDIATGSNVI